jgi:putative FmdB family regulatory protein
MPTYEYACVACGHEFEAFQSFSDSALTECPECKGELRKVYSNVGVVFKGSGFYKTDSRSSTPAASSGSTTQSSPTTPAPAAVTPPASPAKGSETKK